MVSTKNKIFLYILASLAFATLILSIVFNLLVWIPIVNWVAPIISIILIIGLCIYLAILKIKMKILIISCTCIILPTTFLTFNLSVNCPIGYVPSSAYDFKSKTFDIYDQEICSNIKISSNSANVMILTDTHFDNMLRDPKALNYVKGIINDENPDLILLDGDNVSVNYRLTYPKLISLFDSTNIPWAPIFGNHEGDFGTKSKYWQANQFDKSSNCLFKFGPKGFDGAGNYVVNILNNSDELIHSYIMMDCVYKNNYAVTDKQKEWFNWICDGLSSCTSKTTNYSATIMIHVPLPEIADGTVLSGEKHEKFCVSNQNNFFEIIKNQSLIDGTISGHDHTNNLITEYEGKYLCYGLTTTKKIYGTDSISGYSKMSFKSDSGEREQTYLIEDKFINY